MKRLDIMVDIETLGTNSDSTVIQLSAIAFDIRTGEEHVKFNEIADIEKNIQPLNVTGGTIKWWLNTNKELLTILLNAGEYSSEEVLSHFHSWLLSLKNSDCDLYLWGNGILFDNKMIQHQFDHLNLEYPIFYRNDRDLRTLVELAALKLGVSEADLKSQCNDKKLVHHNAFDDVRYQIRVAHKCYQILMSSYGIKL